MENKINTIQRDTRAWRAQVWISFGIAVLVCGTGLAWLPGGDLDRAFMVMGYFFCLSAAFALSKYIRDNAQSPSDTPVVLGGTIVPPAIMHSVIAFMMMYGAVLVGLTMLLVFTGMDLVTAFTAIVACLNCIRRGAKVPPFRKFGIALEQALGQT